MKIKDISQPQKLTIAGLSLPYLVISLMVVIIISGPRPVDDNWSSVGVLAFVLPLISALVGAVLVGLGNVKKEKLEARRKFLVHAFIFGFLWTSIFHFFITIYFFMQIIYTYTGGLKH
jgi:hypothetical protein